MSDAKRSRPYWYIAMKALLRADAIVQSHHRPSIVISVLLPFCFLFNWKHLLPVIGAPNVLAGCISLALPSVGLMGYSLVVARDRELGVFKRLRTTPCTAFMIISSRFIVQLAIMLIVATFTTVAAVYVDKIHTSVASVAWALLAVLLVGPVFLSLGQLVVTVFRSSESVNSATRLIYALILLAGIASQGIQSVGLWHSILRWSPLGVTEMVVGAALLPTSVRDGFTPLLVACLYTLLFGMVGIRWFKWDSATPT